MKRIAPALLLVQGCIFGAPGAEIHLAVEGEGAVTESTTGATCPGDCLGHREGKQLGLPFVLTATPDPGWEFERWTAFGEHTSGCVGWSGDPSNPTLELPTDQSADYGCKAVFVPQKLMRFVLDLGNVDESTIDLTEVAVGQGNGRLGVGVRTDGGPAPDSAYSNFVRAQVKCGSVRDDLVVTVQRHDDVDSTLVEGASEADVLHLKTEWGWYLEMPMPEDWGPGELVFTITAGYLGTPGGEYMEDGSGKLQGQDVQEIEDILFEIEQVFVPA